jgi:hypothetical protein
MRCGCGSGLANNKVSIWEHFGWPTSIEIPACRLKMSPSEGRSSGGREWGGGVTSNSFPSSSSSSLSPFEDLGSDEVSSSRALAFVQAALHSRLLCLRAHSLYYRHGWPPVSPHP